jgi:SAM-dependent methyltransferase
MRVADIGCGPGKTSHLLSRLIGPEGEVVGIDRSRERIEHANKKFSSQTTRFFCRDIHEPLYDLGRFDFIWVRFVLEYFRSSSFQIVEELTSSLRAGGILCLIDLDLNCLNHYDLPRTLESSLLGVMGALEENKDFDPYAGRRLYSYMYDLNYRNIRVDLSAHHLIYGDLNKRDEFNWMTKTLVAAKNSGYDFYNDFSDGFMGFFEAFKTFFGDPRRFTYTPLISCSGTAP